MLVNPCLLLSANIITNVQNPELQLQPNGIDITINKIFELSTPQDTKYCYVGEDSKTLPEQKEVFPDEDGNFRLEPSKVYDILFNEKVKLPIHMSGTIIQRSTLNRCASFIFTGVYDSGYIGGIGAIVKPHLDLRLRKGTRVAQFVCTYADGSHLYKGAYNQKELFHKTENSK